jgi:hypothetical protein
LNVPEQVVIGRAGYGVTTPQARACKEERRRQRARGRPDRVHNNLTQEVRVIEARKLNIHAALVENNKRSTAVSRIIA